MAVTWKKITFDDDVPNIGNTDLTVPSGSRNLTMNAAAGVFSILDNTNASSFQAAKTYTYLGNQTNTVLAGFFTVNTQLFCNSISKNIFCEDVNNFTIESHADSAEAGPILNLTRDPATAGGTDNDELGRIDFRGDNESGTGLSYADITAKIIDSDDTNKNCDLTFRVQDKDVQQSNLIITSSASSGTTLTANEGLLHALKIQTKTLEELTRRTQMVYQCGYNGQLDSLTNNASFNEHELRVSNGVEVIDGSNYTNSTGIIMPFDGYVAGGSFSCKRGSGTVSSQGRLKLVLKKYTSDGTGDWSEDLEVATAIPGAAVPHPVSTSYLIPGTTDGRDDAVKVLKGDMILPFIHVGTQVNNQLYQVDDVIAQFVIYSEEKGQ